MLPFCKLFLGFSKSNPTVITGQSVSAGRPRRNKNATYFINMVGKFVCNVCGKPFMTKHEAALNHKSSFTAQLRYDFADEKCEQGTKISIVK